MIRKTVSGFLRSVGVLGLSVAGMMLVAALVALRHIMETPQPLESPLPGEAHIYRWKRGHIFYKVLGPEEAPPLVLLHAPGIGASSYEMRHLMKPLAQRFRVYAPDLPGFGLSDRPQMDYSAETYIALIQDFLRDVIGLPAVLVANGLSNNYAVAAAQRSPELCERLVLISPTTLIQSESGQAFLPALMQAPLIGTLLYSLVSTHIALRYQIRSRHAASTWVIPASLIDYLYAASHQFGAEHAPLALMAGKLDMDVSVQFANLQLPILMIWGAQALNSLQALPEQHKVPAHAHIELVKDVGTAVHEERPASVIRSILEWSAGEKVTGKPETEVQAEPVLEVGTRAAAGLEIETPAQPEPVMEPAPAQETPVVPEPQQAREEAVQSIQPIESVEQTQLEAPLQEQQPVKVVEAYCNKCKKKTVMHNIEEVTTKNGSPAMRGKCSVCGTGQYRMGRLV